MRHAETIVLPRKSLDFLAGQDRRKGPTCHIGIWLQPTPELEAAMAPKAAAFGVLLLSAAAESGWSALSQPTFGRRTQALPDGFEINETMNGSIPITVIPSWDIFLGFSDRQKTIEGRMSLNIVYGEEAENFVEHPENMVDVVNFGSGSGDINVLSKVRLWDPQTTKTASSISKIYAGDFSQSLYPYVSR